MDDVTERMKRMVRHFVEEVLEDCLSASRHSATFGYYRAERLVLRARIFALLLGLATPVWMAVDLWLLPAAQWASMAWLRVGVGVALMALAAARPPPDLTWARVYLLGLMGLPMVFYMVSQGLLGPTYTEPALIGYTTFPLFVAILLALFPLTVIEGVVLLGILTGLVAGQHALMGVLGELGVMGLLWVLALLCGFALFAQGVHLHMLMLSHRQATLDPLTGLLNRGGLFRRLEHLAAEEVNAAGLPVLVVDLDRFKLINDRYGHPAGDDVLTHLSGVLEAQLGPEDVAGRIGGEEFLLVLGDSDADPEAAAQRLRQVIADRPAETREGPLEISASIGVARWRPDQDLDAVVARADEALYAAKEGGRNMVVLSEGD